MTSDAAGAIARLLFEALYPLKDAFSSKSAFEQLLRDLGHDGTVTDQALADLDAASTIVDLVLAGEDLIAELDDPATSDSNLAGLIVELIELGSALLNAIDAIRSINGADLDPTLADSDLWIDLAAALPGYLLVQHLEAEVPLLYGVLRLFGVITDVPTPLGDTRETIDSGQLVDAVADPAGAVAQRYGWGTSSVFDHQGLITELALILTTLGLDLRTGPVRPQFGDRFFGTDATTMASVSELTLSFFSGFTTDGGYVDVGIALVPVPQNPDGGAVNGLFLTNTSAGGAVISQELPGEWIFEATAGLDATGLVGLRFSPTGTTMEDEPSSGVAALTLKSQRPDPWQFLGGLVEVGSVEAEIKFSTAAGEDELGLAAQVGDAAVLLSLGDGDSFVQSLLGSEPIRIELSPRLQWSSLYGLSLSGTVGLEVVIPLNLRLGPIGIDTLHLMLTGGDGAASFQADVDANAALGPLQLAVSGMGVLLEVTESASNDGTLGPWDVAVGFKPPDGVGVGLDVGVASGGGYLDIDAAAGSYSGVLDIEVLGVGIAAVVIVDTRLPDVDGWSMFFALFLDLPAIQLGFGFTLSGVGGVAGINRAIDIDALGSAVRSGALDTILFPEDPIADAPIIIETFSAMFPPANDSYVFGPIVKIGWGTPALIEAELGIVIQLPDPLVIVVLGSLNAVLPTKEAPLVELHLDVAGAIDFGAGTLAIDASLHDSHVVGFALSGDMALRAEFDNAQAFLMSVGGFHPRFDPPGDFPTLRRLTFGINAGSLLRIDFEAYFALTSNSVQCGARFTLDAQVAGFGVYGSSGFDALIQFSPFRVITSVDFEVSIKAAGVDLIGIMLYASVEGPNRWHVIGTARFEVLGIGKDIRVDEFIGAKENEPPVTAPDIVDVLIDTLETADAWSIVQVNDPTVTLAEVTDPAAPLYANPDALIEVRQRYVPLGIQIERFGEAPVGTRTLFDITTAKGAQTATLDDWFAPGHFFALDSNDKLEGPEFELMRSGIQFGGDSTTAGPDVGIETGYKAYILDPEFPDDETPMTWTATLRGSAGVSAAATTSRGFTVTHAYAPSSTATTYVLASETGAVIERTATWSEAYAYRSGTSGLHIEHDLEGVGA